MESPKSGETPPGVEKMSEAGDSDGGKLINLYLALMIVRVPAFLYLLALKCLMQETLTGVKILCKLIF